MGVGSGRTVTFLFTDVESSTQRWQEDPDGMAAALARHDSVLRAGIEAAGGRVFKHTGDGVCAVFESATRAVAAALQAQSELELRVRIGLHTGEAEEREGDFFGTTLNRCARIMDAGHGGQILLSAVTRALLDGVECVDLGEWVLKGFAQPERILQVGAGRFLPLRTQRRLSFLPGVLTSLIGRDELVGEVADRVRAARLVTLVGVGGCPKARVGVAEGQRWRSRRHAWMHLVLVVWAVERDDVDLLLILGAVRLAYVPHVVHLRLPARARFLVFWAVEGDDVDSFVVFRAVRLAYVAHVVHLRRGRPGSGRTQRRRAALVLPLRATLQSTPRAL